MEENGDSVEVRVIIPGSSTQERESAREEDSALMNGLLSTTDEPSANGVPPTNDSGPNEESEKEDRSCFGRRKKKPAVDQVGMLQLFRYADRLDAGLMILGTFFCMAVGSVPPAISVIFGEMVGRFIAGDPGLLSRSAGTVSAMTNMTTNNTGSNAMSFTYSDILQDYIYYFFILAAISLVCGYPAIVLWTLAAERQVFRIRKVLFQSIMEKDISWFDEHNSVELSTNMVSYMATMSEGMGDKVASLLIGLSTFVGGFIVGLVVGWQLTLTIVAAAPVLVILMSTIGIVIKRFAARELKAYGKAGAVAEEVLLAIRTVFAFGGQTKAIDQYTSKLVHARREAMKRSAIVGSSQIVFFTLIYSVFSIVFYYGTVLVSQGQFHPGTILTVVFAVLLGTVSLGSSFTDVESIGQARAAAFWVYNAIDEKSQIPKAKEGGKKVTITGDIQLEDVHFHYPSRPEAKVLSGITLNVVKGQTAALVGESGCGKSTVMQLLKRFYDTTSGQVCIDGVDIRDYDLEYLRSHIGVVDQEPTLFATTIAQNIRMGSQRVDDVTEEQIAQAAREANCYDFIMGLPKKFDTLVGERGAHISGGQKQRIAIARALIGNPQILLLDEATSALDNESESLVQAALDKASQGRTTIVIAHRLSTIKNADVIFGLKDGVIVERGTHEELLSKEGLYYNLHTQAEEGLKEQEGDENDEADDTVEDLVKQVPLSPHLRSRALSNASTVRSFESKDSLQRNGSFRLRSDSHIGSRQGVSESNKDQTSSTLRILRANRPETLLIIFGTFTSVLLGASQPFFSVIMSEMLAVFVNTDGSFVGDVSVWVMVLVLLGFGVGVLGCGQTVMFGISGERLTQRLRSESFKKMLQQEMAWFDQPENEVGKLTAKLASEASLVKGASGVQIGLVVQAMANLLTAAIIGFIYLWKLALVTLAIFPLAVAGPLVEFSLHQRATSKHASELEDSASIASEAVVNVRTVVGLNKEQHFVDAYASRLKPIYTSSKKAALFFGIAFALSQSTFSLVYAVCFAYGGYLIDVEGAPFFDVIRVFAAITFAGRAIGRIASISPDYAKATTAASKIFSLLDTQTAIDVDKPGRVKLDDFKGDIEFRDVRFSYPTRATVPVLRRFNLSIKSGEKMALVGSSGCGKSTTVSLLERYYDPLHGDVLLDGHSLRDLNVQSLRQHIGVVSQEPTLFDSSIAENIAYGDNTRVVPMEEIKAAARQANIDDFITNLPMGYDTNAGERGTQLSGGQKQRIAIARALVRNPKVLLLDEATSALDTESEKVVQEALNSAQEGKTCIIIAHRLSTVKAADKICVIHKGRVVESGSHQELLDLKGHYHGLVNSGSTS